MSKIQSIKYYCDNKRHLVCVPYSIDNLHKMAEDLKIGSHFYHKGKRNLPHYDIPAKRIKEIQAKCIIVSPKVIVNIIKGKLPD